MTFVAGTFSFMSVIALFVTLAKLDYFKRPRASSLMMLFLFAQYGPLFLINVRHNATLFPEYTFGIIDFGPQIARYVYVSLGVSFLAIAGGYLAVRLASTRSTFIRYDESANNSSFAPNEKNTIRSLYYLLIGLAALTVAALLSNGGIRQQIAFVFHLASGHAEPGDFETMRRAVLPSDPLSSMLGRLRMNYSLPLISCLAACAAYLKRPVSERIIIFSVFFLVVLLDLQKEPMAVAILTIIIATYLARHNGIFPCTTELLKPISVIIATGSLLLFLLYNLQYANNPQVDFWRILQTMYFRVFQADGLDLNLFFLFFPHTLFSQGQTTSTILAPLLGKDLFDVNAYIPQSYGALTTFPTVFFGASWVDFGWSGVVISSFLVGALSALADFIGVTLQSTIIRAAYTACMMFALNYFTQVQFLTCLLTYGVILQMFIFAALDYALSRRKQETSRPLDA